MVTMITTSQVLSHHLRKYPPFYGLVLVAVGLGTVVFSVYMMTATIQQGRRTDLIIRQTEILRDELNNDHLWQVQHHVILEQVERVVRAAVMRKEALMRAWIKKNDGWTDADIDAAIKSEIGNIQEDELPPVEPVTDSPTGSIPGRMPDQ